MRHFMQAYINPINWNTPDGHSPYVGFFHSLHPISKASVRYLDKQTYRCTFKKGHFLSKPGFSTSHLFLIEKGVIRAFRKLGQKEITTWINEENEVVSSIQNIGLQEDRSVEYIQAIEDAELVALPLPSIETLYTKYPEMNIIGRKILEDSYRAAEERAFICRIPSAEMRYQLFLTMSPQLVNRIPLKYIASYLGMTLETLSRVRSLREK